MLYHSAHIKQPPICYIDASMDAYMWFQPSLIFALMNNSNLLIGPII
jgi:hypothetical protein